MRLFCRLCECPVVDGGVQSSGVDRGKFEEWCLDVLETNLADELKKGDVICSFCVWDAEAELNSQEADGSDRLEWWPKSKESLETTTIKNNYMAGKVKPCWVLLENVALSDSDEEDEEEAGFCKREENIVKKVSKWKDCFYCGDQFLRKYIAEHIMRRHKKIAIRCELKSCATYFHSQAEKIEHFKEAHDTPKEKIYIDCFYCDETRPKRLNCYRKHIKHDHPELKFKCSFRGCLFYFKTQAKLDSHYQLVKHGESKKYNCEMCEFKTSYKQALLGHFSRNHLIKLIKCVDCPKMFSHASDLNRHKKSEHTFKVCSFCHLDVSVQRFYSHSKKQLCVRCKIKFSCSGLLQSHLKICRASDIKCEKCAKIFRYPSDLEYHNKYYHIVNRWRGLKNKEFGLKCESCKRYYSKKESLSRHMREKHDEKNLKFCAHCPKKYGKFLNLKKHLAMTHDLIERKFKCSICKKKFYLKSSLNEHVKSSHTGREPKKCRLCDKFYVNMQQHMIKAHELRE